MVSEGEMWVFDWNRITWSQIPYDVSTLLFKIGVILKRRPCVLVWTEHIFKTELFKTSGVTTIVLFPRASFPQTQTQNDR